ncbi:MAG TPA: AsmA family protein [Burkholderiales bacterium]|nr:AsmA family protein [Burkholderiales bacterium]
MKILKYALFALAGLVVLAGAVLAYVAATFDPNQYKPQIVQAVKEKTGRTLKLEGDIALSFWPSIGAKIGKASLSERASDREFAAVETVHVSLKLLPLLSRQAVADTVRVKGLRASIVKAKDGRTNVDDFTGPPAAKGAPAAKDARTDFGLDIAGVEIADAAITYTDQGAGTKYQLSKLNFKTGRIAPGVPTAIEFSAHAQGDKPKLDLPVTLKTRLTLDAAKQSLALEDLVLEAKGAAAGLANLSIRLTGNASVDNARQQVRAALAGKLADSSIKAQVETAGFTAPAIRFDVDIDQIDVDRYLPQQAGSGKPAGAGKKPEKESPFDLTGLRSLRASGLLKVGALKANNVRATNVRMDVKASAGRLEVNPLTAVFYQGSLSSVVTVNAAPATPTFAAKHNMNGINVGAFIKDLAGNDTLEGKGNLTADVTTQGSTVSALKKALGGNAAVKLTDGAVKGIDIAGSIRNARAKLGALRGEQTQAADKSQRTDFSELTATFNIKNGVAHNNDLSLKSPLLRVGGEGDINVGEDTINYLVKASIVGTSKGQGGRDTDELKGVTVPVRVTGPLAAPSYKLDFGAMATDTAKQKAMDELQKRLGGGAAEGDATKKDGAKSGDGTRDRLRGILGR